MLENRRIEDWLQQRVARLANSSRTTKRVIVVANDAACCVLAVWISFVVRMGIWVGINQASTIFAAFELVVCLGIFGRSGVYNNVLRFHGPKGLARIARCCVTITAPSVAIFGLIGVNGVPRTLSVIFPLVFFALVAVSRIVARFVILDVLPASVTRRRVMIYGAGTAGRQLASSLEHESGYELVGYVDDDPQFAGQRLDEVPVLTSADLAGLVADKAVDLVLLALPSLQRSARAKIVQWLQAHDIHVQTLPTVQEIVSGDVSVSDLREIEIADLLAREQVQADARLLSSAVAGKTVMVTGAGGSIGSELCRQIARLEPRQIILVEMTEAALFEIDQEVRGIVAASGAEVNVRAELASLVNRPSVDRIFNRWRPDTVFHAAAYKHVPLVEANPVAGVGNNVFSTLNCALAACAVGVERFILVSTDKAVRPTNVMGASKRVCELILQAISARQDDGPIFAMVRFGNVLGSSGSVVPHFKRQISAGGPVTVTHRNVTRFFMTIPEAAELVIQAGAMAQGGEVYLLDMGDPIRIYDLAKTMIVMSGRAVRDAENPDGDIEIVEIGLRPGEKLYEELLIGAEATPTEHERIYRAREESVSWGELSPQLERMREAMDQGDNAVIRRLLSELVAGYRPSIVGLPAHQCETIEESLDRFGT